FGGVRAAGLQAAFGRRPHVAICVATQHQAGRPARSCDVEVEHDALTLEPDFRKDARLWRLFSLPLWRPAREPFAVESENASTHDASWLQTSGHSGAHRFSVANRLNRASRPPPSGR